MILFEEMGLDASLLKAVKELGFETPTPIQEKVIPRILTDKVDLIALAQTGTGKTAAFGLPLIQMADTSVQDIQGLILCPTRELCMQITNDLKTFSKYEKGFKVVPVYGGASVETQIKSIKKGAQIVVGTPGRMLDLIKRKVVKVGKIRWLVLDEADEMLNMGFKEDLDAILAGTPADKQTLLFSATMPFKVVQLAKTILNAPEKVDVTSSSVVAEGIHQVLFYVPKPKKIELCLHLLRNNIKGSILIFRRTKFGVEKLEKALLKNNFGSIMLTLSGILI